MTCPLKRQFIFNGLHGVVFQNVAFFLTTIVRSAYPVKFSPQKFLPKAIQEPKNKREGGYEPLI
jgi:hypothetical protein